MIIIINQHYSMTSNNYWYPFFYVLLFLFGYFLCLSDLTSITIFCRQLLPHIQSDTIFRKFLKGQPTFQLHHISSVLGSIYEILFCYFYLFKILLSKKKVIKLLNISNFTNVYFSNRYTVGNKKTPSGLVTVQNSVKK